MSVELDVAEARQINLNGETGGDGLARLVMTLVKLIHDLLERQAIRRMERGTLDDEELERLGMALMSQADEITRMCEVFGLDVEDLDIDLGGVHYIDG